MFLVHLQVDHNIRKDFFLLPVQMFDKDPFPFARGVMVIVVGIGHGDTSSNPGLIAFHIALIPLGKV